MDEWVLTDGLSNSYVKTQWAEGEGCFLPGGVTPLADPEHLHHQEEPLEEKHNGDGQHDPLLRCPWSNAHDGEDDGEAGGPDGAVVESTDYDQSVSGRSDKGVWATNLPM